MIFLIAIFACKKEKTAEENIIKDSIVNNETNTEQNNTEQSSVGKIETFGLLPEVQGCSCYFAQNKDDLEQQKYIYADDYGNTAFVKVNGKLVRIPMEEGDFDPDNFGKVIENNDYKIEMKGKKIKELEEVMMFEGEMTVTNKKTGAKITTSIYGECGC